LALFWAGLGLGFSFRPDLDFSYTPVKAKGKASKTNDMMNLLQIETN
jgi:hypothetical protein